MENFELRSVGHTENKEIQNSNEEITYNDPSADDMVRFLEAIEPYEDENGDIAEIPDIVQDGKFNKDLFAGLMMYKAPQYALVGNESAREVLSFLRDLNTKLSNPTLDETITYLESQVPYLDTVNEISDKTFQEFDTIVDKAGKIDWFADLEKNSELLTKANQANLFRAKVEVLFTNLVNRTYDGLWSEYLGNHDSRKKIEE